MPRTVSMRCSVVFSSRDDLPNVLTKKAGGRFSSQPKNLSCSPIERVEQHDAAQAIVGTTGVEDERGRVVAAAIGRDHDRRVVERAAGAGVAVKLGQAVAGFAHELGEYARLPEPAGAGIEGVHRELRRHQHRVEPGFGDLPRHRLAIAHVAFERRFVAVEEHDHERGPAGIKSLGDVQQDALVTVGLVLPIGPAAHRGVTVPLTVGNVEERAVLVRHLAAIGERRHLERDQRRLRRRQRRKLALGYRRGDGVLRQQQAGKSKRGAELGERPKHRRGHAGVAAGAGEGVADGCSGSSTAKKAGIANR